MQRPCRVIALLCCLLLLLPTCLACSSTDTDPDKLRIVCTIFPQYDVATHIAGTRAVCEMLLDVGTADSHAWEPTARQFRMIADADLLLAVGGESEAWAEELSDACNIPTDRVLRLLDVVEGVTESDHHDHHDHHDHAHAHTGHDHLDEHVWTDPANMVSIAHAVADLLCRVDPAGTAYYRQNETAYVAELGALADAYHAALDAAPQRVLVMADQFPFRYLAQAYGLTCYAAFPGCSADTEPSLDAVYTLIREVETRALPVVLFVAHSGQKIVDVVCESTGAEKRALHACHTISAAELAAGESYITLMEQNLAVLKEALGLCS